MKIKLPLLVIYYSIVVFLIAYLLCGDILFSLNSIQLDRSGDGFKNYFAFAYQYHYGVGNWFTGMQYPYGDAFTYTDGQPAILFLFKALKYIGLDISGYELFVVQFLPILGLFFGALILHKIVSTFQSDNIWTLITVTACLALSPQLFRFNAHFTLAYVFCFPSIWWLIILNEKKTLSNIITILLVSSLVLIYGFIHPYHLLICALFLCAYFGVNLLFKKFNYVSLISGCVPIILFLLISGQFDLYDDRTLNPWGAWHFKTEKADFLPFYGWFKNLFGGLLPLRNRYHEGYNYVGVLVFVVPVIIFSGVLLKRIKISFPKSLIKFFLASVLMLLFSMAIHMRITDMQINEWVSSLKQFRALGRFSWPFYYVSFICLAIYFTTFLTKLNNKYLKYGIVSFVLIFWLLDIYSYTKAFRKNMNEYKSPNELYQNKKMFDAIANTNFDVNNFQAVIPLPIPTEGAEKFSPQENWFVKTQVMPFTFQTEIPFVGGYMSRMSLSRILKQYQFSCSEYIERNALDDLNSEKDFLIVLNKKDSLEFEDIISKSYPIAKTKENLIYGISIESISQTKKIIEPDTIDVPIFYNNFEESDSEGMLSKGTFEINGAETICELKADSLAGQILDFSIWYRIDVDKSNAPFFSIKCYKDTNKELSAIEYNDKKMKRIEVIENWVQLKIQHTIPIGTQTIRWSVKGEYLAFDHALITRSQDTYFKKLDENYAMFNHFIGKIEE